MKILVIGCGSIGERHIKNLQKISAGEILAYDEYIQRAILVQERYKMKIFKDLKEALNQNPDIVFVCTPPSSHIEIALEAINANAHVFIEKPLSHNLDKVDDLIKKANEKNLIIFVGYNFRYQKGMKLVKKYIDEGKIGKIITARAEFGQYLPDWRPWQDYKKSYTAKKELGGGIILDGSHELDYIRWLIGEPENIFCIADKLSNLEVETEDVADIILKSQNGAICSIHMDFVRPEYSRYCEIIGEKGIIYWDYEEKIIKIYYPETKNWDIIETSDETDDMYINEIKHLIKCIKNKEKPLTDGIEGKKTLELALAALKSAESQKLVKL